MQDELLLEVVDGDRAFQLSSLFSQYLLTTTCSSPGAEAAAQTLQAGTGPRLPPRFQDVGTGACAARVSRDDVNLPKELLSTPQGLHYFF